MQEQKERKERDARGKPATHYDFCFADGKQNSDMWEGKRVARIGGYHRTMLL
jgi:hypothetical protein